MKGYVDNIEQVTEDNSDFRRVLYTGSRLQLVIMSLLPGEEIGEEVHDDGDQFFRFETGTGEVLIDGVWSKVGPHFGVVVPGGASHNVKNTGTTPLKFYTIYGPPEHVDGTVHATAAEAHAAHEHWDGKTSE